MRDRFRVSHLSLWWGEHPKVVAAYIAATIADLERRREPVGLVTCTEANGRAKHRAIRKALGKRWHVARRGELLIIRNRRIFGRQWGRAAKDRTAYRSPWFTRKGGRRLFRVMQWDLRHKPSGRRVRVQTGHAPSSVQRGLRWRGNTRRTTASQQGFGRWGLWVRAFHRRNPEAVSVLTMDANLDQREKRWRDYLTGALAARSIWSVRLPRIGTHGPRLIDTGHVEGAGIEAPRVLTGERPARIDHKGVTFVVRL